MEGLDEVEAIELADEVEPAGDGAAEEAADA